MKTLLWLSTLLVALSIGYNIGLRAGLAKGQHTTEAYRTLYYQALEYRDWQEANLPHITKAKGLKEKE